MPDPAPTPRRGDQEPRPPSLIPRGRRWLWFLAGLLALNLLLSFATGGPESRERVPYQPFFASQVGAGNVKEISSRGDSIEGQLEHETLDQPDAYRIAGVDVPVFDAEQEARAATAS